MAHRVSPQAITDLDNIWYYVATASGTVEAADQIVDSLADRFFPNIRILGVLAMKISGAASEVSRWTSISSCIASTAVTFSFFE